MKTDQQLKQDVIAELAWEPAVNASQIGVEVKDGIVTLAGHVGSFTEKWQAEQAAQRVCGVKGLAVEMDVNLPGISNRTDADIARSVENTLQWQSYLPKGGVNVMVENGWVTLSGEVDWNYQRLRAADAVRNLLGVRGLTEHRDQTQGSRRQHQGGHRSSAQAPLGFEAAGHHSGRPGRRRHAERQGPEPVGSRAGAGACVELPWRQAREG